MLQAAAETQAGVVADLQRRLVAANAARPASHGVPHDKVRPSLATARPSQCMVLSRVTLATRMQDAHPYIHSSSCCPAQVQQLVQQLASAEAARDASEARLAALSAGEADGLAPLEARNNAHGNSKSASTLQKVHVALVWT